MSPPKVCAVCGDKALGYNFNAVTCESCKAFFRRNALAKKSFSCPFSHNCEITVVTRRFCQKCRLKKCLDIGMKSENIMSEEDKVIKRMKIESNRAKRSLSEKKNGSSDNGKSNDFVVADSSGFDISHDSQSCNSVDSKTTVNLGSVSTTSSPASTSKSMSSLDDATSEVKPELMTAEEMVDFIVGDPDRASQAISKLMRTSTEAMATLEKIINSQKEALRLISHLIAFPGDALKIISKLMNSPFDALTVFTKFMSSPTDALEIISKVVSSPQDVIVFVKSLMNSPEDALDIMNKFMNTPAEALKIINKIFNASNGRQNSDKTTNETGLFLPTEDQTAQANPQFENKLIHSMLNSSPASQTPQHTTQTQSLKSTTPPPTENIPQASMAILRNSAGSDFSYQSPQSTSFAQVAEHHSPSTSAGVLEATPVKQNFARESFDIKAFLQNSLPENPSLSESINSLETVLSEVIRIEYQTFNNLSPGSHIKQERCGYNATHGFIGYGSCNTAQQQQVQQPICAPSSIIMGRDLNEAEQMKLRELKLASEALYYPLDEEITTMMMNGERIKPEDTDQNSKLLQVINLTAIAIKRLIKMAKKITAFRDMCQEDQVALLKGGCTEMMIMRSVMTYDDNRNTWKIPHTKEGMSNINAEVLKQAKGNVYEEHLKFIRTFDEKWRMDENIILIMCAIVLFMPTRSRIIHSDVIKLEQNSYYYLLRRYLESVYTGCEAKSAFIKLIQKVADVERLNQVIIGVYLNVNPSQVEPLLREIFDLKNH